jgi:hypothetical protein
MSTALAPITDDPRSGALLKAIGLEIVPPEQRELALAIADRYGLDLMLKHLVLVDGRPYITRDGLLHIAHRSGQFDGMDVTDPVVVDVGAGKFWTARCSVHRKDMSRPFTYAGRYPTTGGNQKFAPEMAVKVAEVMALRRAFDVSAPVIEERWDMDGTTAPDPEPPKSTAQQIAERRAAIAPPPPEPEIIRAIAEPDDIEGEVVEPVQCASMSDPALGTPEQCRREQGHKGVHKTPDQSWP